MLRPCAKSASGKGLGFKGGKMTIVKAVMIAIAWEDDVYKNADAGPSRSD